MQSQIQIANRALTRLGSARIIAIDENTKQARSVAALWDGTRDNLLRAYRWGFAMRRTTLPALTTTPSWGFDREFQLPSDFIGLDIVGDYYAHIPGFADYVQTEDSLWAVEGRKILTDLPAPLPIRYKARVTNTAEWDASFDEAMSCRLMVDLCEDLTQSNTKLQAAKELFATAIREAIRAQAIEQAPVSVPDSSWMLSRI